MLSLYLASTIVYNSGGFKLIFLKLFADNSTKVMGNQMFMAIRSCLYDLRLFFMSSLFV